VANLRSYLDPNEAKTAQAPNTFPTEQKGHQVQCSLCNAPFIVDEETYRFATEGLEAGMDNPFKCSDCEQEYGELTY
jgi:hypothetical protein